MAVELGKAYEIEPRTPDWLRKHGKCLEHLKSKPSLIPDAGRGGFARHLLHKGDIVVPTPMLHIIDRDSLHIYDDAGILINDQILLNYCFGHSMSTVLLCPNTNALLMNHCSNKNCKVNAELRWATDNPISEEWRNTFSLQKLSKQKFRGLAMDVVATRTIHPGEEVYFNYGSQWEKAWIKHKKHFDSDKTRSTLSAKEANLLNDIPNEFMTHNLRSIQPSSTSKNTDYLFTVCRFWLTDFDNHVRWEIDDNGTNWTTHSDKEILKRYASDGSEYGEDVSYEFHHDYSYWPCDIVSKDEEDSTTSMSYYLVRILQSRFHTEENWSTNGLPRLLTRYPRSSIEFFVKKNDQYELDENKVFRHPIAMMPEHLFPEQWKNLK